jgi:metal-responsive CopG/Arc/MetJ family transcriptional regulator
MARMKVAVTLDRDTLGQLDRMVKESVFPSRSRGIEVALAEKLERMERGRLARECAKLDVGEEQSLAEEGLSTDAAEWPEY